MISQEQKDLADYVKEVHLSLRRRARQIGAEKAWEEHLKKTETLQEYAYTMKNLAENFWCPNNKKEANILQCRIEWVKNCITEYYYKGEYKKQIEKEYKKINLFCKSQLINDTNCALYEKYMNKCSSKTQYKLLDVGSCYNPLKNIDYLDVYAIDLCPAVTEVRKCNFLNVTVADIKDSNWFYDEMQVIPSKFFDIVVFSLFLEYLPSPEQRYCSCEKAYSCLKTNGLLIIITPDSKPGSGNAPIMKQWKIAAACIGFNRIKLEKLKYIYCMAFRKSISRRYPLLLSNIRVEDYEPEKMFYIRQDAIDYGTENTSDDKMPKDEYTVMCGFSELPFS